MLVFFSDLHSGFPQPVVWHLGAASGVLEPRRRVQMSAHILPRFLLPEVCFVGSVNGLFSSLFWKQSVFVHVMM